MCLRETRYERISREPFIPDAVDATVGHHAQPSCHGVALGTGTANDRSGQVRLFPFARKLVESSRRTTVRHLTPVAMRHEMGRANRIAGPDPCSLGLAHRRRALARVTTACAPGVVATPSRRHTGDVALPTFAPMLASTKHPTIGADWVFEPKLDGWRALVYVDGTVKVRTRTGRDITDRVDHPQALTDLGRRMVLDGELVADAGKAGDFYLLGPNLRASSRRDITFVAFDLLVLDDDNLCDRPYRDRRSALEALNLVGPGLCTIRVLDGSPRDLLDACAELDVEGVVAKRVDSPYRPGVRSGDWLKLRTADWKRGYAPRRHR